MRSIEIDLDVHRMIENNRASFDEDENAILRRLLGIDGQLARVAQPRPRQQRSSGAYSIFFGDEIIEANSLKELLRRSILKGEKMRPGLAVYLSAIPTPRGRYLVARSPADIYPKSPQLAEYAQELFDGWWYDTNVSKGQVQAHLKTLAKYLALPNIPTIHKRTEKSTLTLGDLDLSEL
jgi:hypothetical protein